MHIPESAFEELMWVHVRFLRRADREEHFTEHPAGIREITGLRLTTLVPLRSAASQRIFASKMPSTRTGLKPLLEIEFDGKRRNQVVDFRPHLPIVFRCIPAPQPGFGLDLVLS
jgi:hypothetical protein